MTYVHNYTADRHERFAAAFREDPTQLLELAPAECETVKARLTEFYRGHLESSGLRGYVVGLSGGIDSSVTAHLLADAVGPERVFGVIMPAEHSSEDDVEHARAVADRLGIPTNDPDQVREHIDDAVETLERLGRRVDDEEEQRVKRGNILARCRMIVARDVAKARESLVAGTTNASERDLGYMTLAADGLGGIDNEALYELYKTSVRSLARFMDVDEAIIEKLPSADLWKGQRDKDELLHGYDVLDQILVGIAIGMDDDAIVDAVDAAGKGDAAMVRERKQEMAYKRDLPPHPSFS
ncbi:MAG: NAD(+) synthase [Candidatus Nanohaloarchaea archaeon]|nr:NAD(+) synthase [Candidatus Nanohaloarchaea archaeon]